MKKLAAILLSIVCAAANAAPKPDLWAFWDKHGAQTGAVSHDAWGAFLARHLSAKDGIALLDYGGVSAEDKKSLDEYAAMLAAAPVRDFSRPEQLAYWINLYNALTVKTVLENYPVSSIKKISSGFLPTGPWDDKLIKVDGEELSLNDIEHRVLRPIWKDARLHYAVNCASIGCPNLAAEAWTAENAEEMLEAAAAAYINHPRGAEVKNGKLQVSSIYAWFAEDFGGGDAAVIAHLKKYAAPELRAQLEGISEIADDDYDWSLNGKK
ncbi:MAG: DUF547 domain-containing protein [Betaproteobacteria bacterium]|nr:DUF547 domain-containing protein [Betaproteobacteria bacterium]